MKSMWTPWRMEHVQTTTDQSENCLFEPPGTGVCSKEHLLLYRDHDCLCLLNRFPYTNGHLLVAPSRHAPCLTDLSGSEVAPLMALVTAATTILRRTLEPDGFNIGCNIGSEAGAGIAEHLHFHIVPRWRDDHNFMTVLAEVRAIPEHIETTYDRLLPEFQAYHQIKRDNRR